VEGNNNENMSEILKAIRQICEEKGLSYEAVIETVESALAAAYRKDFGRKNQNIKVEFDPETGKSKVYDIKTVVEDLPEEVAIPEGEEEEVVVEVTEAEGEEEEKRKFNPKTEMQISDAKLVKKTAKIGDEIKMKLEVPESYGRMAAQTAKQVIIQRLREAEREMIFNDFKDKENEVVSGVVQRREGKIVLVDLGKSVGVLPAEEQIPGERYNSGDRIKVYVKEVASRAKGPEIILSRTSDEILKKVFYLEIPEISNGLIEIKGVAREAGSRSKVAVWTDSENVDPIGSCVGQRGARIQTIIQELGGEKVDIIAYDEEPIKFISNALSPAKIISITTNEEEKKATVVVAGDQLSLAIGKGGQNARLAARLTGWKIDIIENQEGKRDEIKKEDEEETSVPESDQDGAVATEANDQPTE
jgi:transcription termination/antitermination protein NusA